jgi:hypothetical protein
VLGDLQIEYAVISKLYLFFFFQHFYFWFSAGVLCWGWPGGGAGVKIRVRIVRSVGVCFEQGICFYCLV